MTLDSRGWEVPDPHPMEVPAGFKRPESLESMMRRFIRNEVSQQASARGHETFEEAMDFNVDDEDGLGGETPWEVAADQAAEVEEMREREYIAAQLAKLKPSSQGGVNDAPEAGAPPAGQAGSGPAGLVKPTVQDLSSTVRTDRNPGAGDVQGQAAGPPSTK